MHQSCCLEPEVKVAGSLVTGNGFCHLERSKLKYAYTILYVQMWYQKKKEKENKKNGGQTLTHAATAHE